MRVALEPRRIAGALLALGLLAACDDVAVPDAETFPVSMRLLRSGTPVAGTLAAVGRDRQGAATWQGTFALVAAGTVVRLPLAADAFDFTLSGDGATRAIRLPAEHIRRNPEFLVGLADADYHRYVTSDRNIEILLSRDPTNPYFEITLQDPHARYGWIDRAFYKDGAPVADMLYRGLDSFAPGRQADNATFAPFKRFRGQQGATWDAADSALVYGGETLLHEW